MDLVKALHSLTDGMAALLGHNHPLVLEARKQLAAPAALVPAPKPAETPRANPPASK